MTDNPSNVVRLPQPSQPTGALATTRLCDLPLATRSQGNAELGACLTLVSPSGMSAEDRREWLAVAMKTLSGIPADLLSRGCEAARLKCRFPSEIVPTIMETIGKQWEWRKADAAWAERKAQWTDGLVPYIEYDPEPLVDPKELRDLIRSIGR